MERKRPWYRSDLWCHLRDNIRNVFPDMNVSLMPKVGICGKGWSYETGSDRSRDVLHSLDEPYCLAIAIICNRSTLFFGSFFANPSFFVITTTILLLQYVRPIFRSYSDHCDECYFQALWAFLDRPFPKTFSFAHVPQFRRYWNQWPYRLILPTEGHLWTWIQ